MAVKRSTVVELFWRVHPRLYRWTSGRIGGFTQGLPVLLLSTRGRKTGKPRSNALMYFPHPKGFVVVASFLGEPRHPAWWLNLQATPDTSIQVGRARHEVRAREAEGEERAELWRAATRKAPDYAEYQTRTTRRIPVVVLERK